MTISPLRRLQGALVAASLTLYFPFEASAQASAEALFAAPAKPDASKPDTSMPGMDHEHMDMDHMDMDHMDHGAMSADHAEHSRGMTGVLGAYPMTRDASGTSWQPDSSTHDGLHIMTGDWMFMAHATLNAVYDRQNGPRGDDKFFTSGMVMGSALRTFSHGDLVNFRVMLSPDPLMGKRGYPLLLASGESADGRTHLVDRQHPHDLFMELSTSYSHPLSDKASAFIYAGLPGEPAFGPPAFMHRASIMDSPEAPISHHWLDSTHITSGVATGGVIYQNWKAEVSRFTGREPDESRTDIDHPRFDSTSARLSWNPTGELALQVSWAQMHSPEALHANENERRWSASAIYTMPLWESGQWTTTVAWGRKEISDGTNLNAWVLESAIKPSKLWTVFARAERVQEAELQTPSASCPPETVSKVSVGVVRDFRVTSHASVGLGGLYAFNWIPPGLKASYGGNPGGAMVFARLKIE